MLQITKQRTSAHLSDPEIALLKKQWKKHRAIVLPKLLEPDLLNHIRQAVGRGQFNKVKHSGVDATELTLKQNSTINLLEMMASDPSFSKVISKITGLKPIGYFQGRVYNIRRSDHDDWHQDTGYNYLMAMSINLSPKPYKGGSLKLRDVKTKEVFSDIQNVGPGDALIFNIDPSLEHKITPVTGSHPKIAFAGWFCPEPTYQNYMNKIIHKVIKKSKMIPTTQTSVDLSKPPKVLKSIAFRSVGAKTFIVNLRDHSQCVLNGMASRIWKGICTRASREAILSDLKEKYSGSDSELEMEYAELVAELGRIGYLTFK